HLNSHFKCTYRQSTYSNIKRKTSEVLLGRLRCLYPRSFNHVMHRLVKELRLLLTPIGPDIHPTQISPITPVLDDQDAALLPLICLSDEHDGRFTDLAVPPALIPQLVQDMRTKAVIDTADTPHFCDIRWNDPFDHRWCQTRRTADWIHWVAECWYEDRNPWIPNLGLGGLVLKTDIRLTQAPTHKAKLNAESTDADPDSLAEFNEPGIVVDIYVQATQRVLVPGQFGLRIRDRGSQFVVDVIEISRIFLSDRYTLDGRRDEDAQGRRTRGC
ncbi:hypothetical protein P154DRAFT_590459, partial [Amniculicola lignicola CBS 123094]